MTEFMDHLKHRIEETKQRLQIATEKLQQAISDREMLNSDLQGYEGALAAEMRSQGIAAPKIQAKPILPVNGNHGSDVSKAEFARRFIRDRVETGSTPTDLFNGFVAAGIPIKKPYVYSLIQRLQKQATIKARRGKYYPDDQDHEAGKETA